jgi:hypothetical protein
MSAQNASVTEVLPEEQSAALEVQALEPLTADRSYRTKRDADARVTIAKSLVVAYLVLLAAQVLAPFILTRSANALDSQVLDAIDTLTKPVAAAITSLTGILGFVLGYYFKSEESKST